MKTKLNYILLVLSIILFFLSLMFFYKHNTLVNKVENSAELSYSSFIAETKKYANELKNFIDTNKNSGIESLIMEANNMRISYQNYELFVSTLDDSETKFYKDRTELFQKIVNSAPDFKEASVEDLQSYNNQLGDIIKILEKTK
ncbi:hypothetical protein [Paenibacillus tundrae]|uniref:Division protein CdvB (Snf7/Vps24/ESCRT-III family) n=1 Tax=Paenibacillus tundrae TaxID=528187 RepID=A0ABT9WJU0_9BACL|nr:hypothetical protein [Paenibacillus tundrae]MDQ0173557.1 division protein CdvB (Snf7/Vps24/ESCRT-III family) [Paenibacillus tundrae]